MSGILGIVYFDGRPVDHVEIQPMRRASRVRAVDGEDVWIDGPVAIGHQHSRVTPESLTERQPLAADGVVVSFDGRLDNRDELRAAAGRGAASGGDLSDPALVALAYRAHGHRCAAQLVGDFAFALMDLRERRLLLARDIMAARPLYFAPLRDGIAFASDIRSLLAHPDVHARPDEDGLADLLLNGYCDGRTTWFDGIHSVPPGSIVVATPKRLTVARAWDFPDAQIRYASRSEYVDHFRALFSQAVRRRLRSAHPVAVSVSGGLDSSAIQCEAARAGGVPVRGFTLAFPEGSAADERPYVEALRRYGLAIDDIPIQQVRWVVDPDRSVDQMEMPSLAWEEYDTLLDRAKGEGCRVLLTGFFGDQMLTGGGYLVDLLRRGQCAAIRRHLREAPAWMTDADPGVSRRWFRQAAIRAFVPPVLRRAARTILSRGLNRTPYAPWFTDSFRERALERGLARSGQRRRFASVHAEECWRLVTSGYYLSALLQSGSAGIAHELETAYPFRDRDLAAFLMAIPGDIVNDGGVPKGLLRQALAGVVPEPVRLRRSKGDATAFSNRAAMAEEQTIRRLLGAEALSARAGFVDPGALQKRMPQIFGAGLARDDSAALGWQLGDTVALELWMRRFCAGATCS